jgi:hypothetical protein
MRRLTPCIGSGSGSESCTSSECNRIEHTDAPNGQFSVTIYHIPQTNALRSACPLRLHSNPKRSTNLNPQPSRTGTLRYLVFMNMTSLTSNPPQFRNPMTGKSRETARNGCPRHHLRLSELHCCRRVAFSSTGVSLFRHESDQLTCENAKSPRFDTWRLGFKVKSGTLRQFWKPALVIVVDAENRNSNIKFKCSFRRLFAWTTRQKSLPEANCSHSRIQPTSLPCRPRE